VGCGNKRAPDGTVYWQPECIGGAAMGLGYCTCRYEAAQWRRAKEEQDRMSRLEARLATLEQKLANAAKP
jgi:hypothetical protein